MAAVHDKGAVNAGGAPRRGAPPAAVHGAMALLGVGVAIAWTACRAGISYFSGRWASQYYVFMQVAYNVPALPVLLLQSACDARVDRACGVRRGSVARLVGAMVTMAAALLVLPYGSNVTCLAVMAVVGVCDAVAYGTASQLFPLFPVTAAGYYFIGASLTSVIAIALQFATRFAQSPPPPGAPLAFYATAAAVQLAGLGAAVALLLSRAGAAAIGGDQPAADDDHDALLLAADDDKPPAAAAGVAALLRATQPLHASLAVGWTTTTLVDSLIAYVPSQGDTATSHDMTFRMWVLYASLFGELAGKQLNIVAAGRWITSPRTLVALQVARLAATALFFTYLWQPRFTANAQYDFRLDALYYAWQAVFDMSGAFLSSTTYGMVAACVTAPADRSRASLLLGVTLTLGVYAGLAGSFGAMHSLNAMVAT